MATIKNKKQDGPISQIYEVLNENKGFHYNGMNDIDYRVSSGSILLDCEIDGGLNPGAHRFIGGRENGKTSAALSFARNFQLKDERNFVVYFKAEGRLAEGIKERSGIDFSENKWCLIDSNVIEVVTEIMRTLVRDNPQGRQYMFIIDSVDALITKVDLEKSSEETVQPGTRAVKLGDLFRKMNLALSKRGHIVLFISQERSSIEINPYGPKQQKQGNSSGGNAIQHYVNFALSFKQRTKADLIFPDDDKKGRPIGHYCTVELLKTSNEKTHVTVKYPVRYGAKNGNSIWWEYEIVDVLRLFQFIKKDKAWYGFAEDTEFVKSLFEKFPQIEKQFHGEANLYKYFDENKEISQYIRDNLKSVVDIKS